MSFLRSPEISTLASEIKKAGGTEYYYFRPDNYNYTGLQLILTGSGTLTLEATLDGDAYGTPTWVDVTNDTFGAATFTASALNKDYLGKLTCYARCRVKMVATDVKEVTQIVAVADVAKSLDGKYFILYDEVGSVGFWIDVDNDGASEPAGSAACDRSVEITTITTAMTKAQVGTAVYNAVVADAKFEAGADGGAGTVTVASTTTGDKSTADAGTSGFTITESTAGAASYKIILKQV